jgi:hypothetical protein
VTFLTARGDGHTDIEGRPCDAEVSTEELPSHECEVCGPSEYLICIDYGRNGQARFLCLKHWGKYLDQH